MTHVLNSVTHLPSDPQHVMHINQLGARTPALHLQFFNAPCEAVQAVALLQLQWEPNGGQCGVLRGQIGGRAQIF